VDLVGEGRHLILEREGGVRVGDGFLGSFDTFDFSFDTSVVHSVDDDTDNKVQHDHGAEENEADKIADG